MRDQVTYVVGVDEPIHPDPEVAARFTEVTISTCAYGCKIYDEPCSAVRVLAHNATYGCTVSRKDLLL